MSSDRLATGDFVICTHRVPSLFQPWLHPIWIGIVEDPSDDPAQWNESNSEAEFCRRTGKLRVRYRDPLEQAAGFVEHDSVDSLIKLTPAEVSLSGLGAVRHFLGTVAAFRWRQAMEVRP